MPEQEVARTAAQEVQPMPELSPEEYAALRADIDAHGVLVPITVDQHGRVLDGHHRSTIAVELGIACPRVVQQVKDDEEAMDLAVTLNCARRHLSREQVRAIIASETARRPDDSDRAIARRVGCSASTVGAVRRPVSKLDTATVEESLTSVRRHLSTAREHLLVLSTYLLTGGTPPTDIIAALNHSQRSWAAPDVGNREAMALVTEKVFDPMINLLLDPEFVASMEPSEPLDAGDRAAVLDELAHLSPTPSGSDA